MVKERINELINRLIEINYSEVKRKKKNKVTRTPVLCETMKHTNIHEMRTTDGMERNGQDTLEKIMDEMPKI